MSRGEYDLLQLRTDGEVTDPETWEYIISNFEAEENLLLQEGLVQLFEQVCVWLS